MTRKHGIDGNHRQLVDELRQIGATVLDLASVGGGAPDLLVGYRGFNYLCEVKDPTQPRSKRKLRDNQKEWHGAWLGHVCRIETLEQFLAEVERVEVHIQSGTTPPPF